jgi:hypothetical protein
MKTFKDEAPLCLSLPWAPPPNVDHQQWRHALGDRVEDAGLYETIGHFNCYDVTSDRILFYMHPKARKTALSKMLRHDKNWIAFKRDNPDAELTWAEDGGD